VALGLDDQLRRSAAVPRGELDLEEVRRRAVRWRWARRVRQSVAVLVLVAALTALAALGAGWLDATGIL
jgi:fatty acid desaturase